MKITKSLLHIGVLGLSILASNVMAAVSADEAAKLGTTLTPMGAEMAGNAAGTIPKWSPMPTNAGARDAARGAPDSLASRLRPRPPVRAASGGAAQPEPQTSTARS